MNCLLAAATTLEIAPFLERYQNNDRLLSMDNGLDVLITGIGLTAATYRLHKQITLKRPDLVIQAGITGCFDKTVPLATILTVSQDTIADQGVIEEKKWEPLFDLSSPSGSQFPFEKGWLPNPHKALLAKTGLKAVPAISINQVSTSRPMIGLYQQKFHPTLESMEGAALHYVCLQEKIPFLQLRAVSNYVGQRDKKKWKMKESITFLNQELVHLLGSL